MKLSKEDYDLLIPRLDRNLAVLKILLEPGPDKEELEKERAEEAKKKKVERKKRNLESLSAKEREWLQNCLNGTEGFRYLKERLQYLKTQTKICIDMVRVAQHFINELDLCPSEIVPLKAMVDTIEAELDYPHTMLSEQLEEWEPPKDINGLRHRNWCESKVTT